MPNRRRLPSEGRSCRCPSTPLGARACRTGRSSRPDQLLPAWCNSSTAAFEAVGRWGRTSRRSQSFRGSSHSRRAAGSYPAFREAATASVPTNLARWRSSERSSLIRRRSRVRIPLEPPSLSKRGRVANAARCRREALTGYEGASPSASTMHPTRRKRRTVLVRQTAGRTSPWMLDSLRTWWNSRHVGPRSRRAKAHEGAIPSARTKCLSASGGVYTHESQKLAGESPCRCKSCLADQFFASSSNESRRPASQAGNAGASPVGATNARQTLGATCRPCKSDQAGAIPAAGPILLPVVKELSRGSAKAEFRVQFPTGGPFPRVVKLQSCGASNAVLWVGVPPRGPLCSSSRPQTGTHSTHPRFARAAPFSRSRATSPRGREAQASAF